INLNVRHSILIRFVLLISLTALIWSCKKEPDLLGLDLIPEGDLLNHEYIDTVTIEAITIKEDTLKTKNLAISMLGSINDSVFGRTTTSIYTRFVLPSNKVVFGNSAVVDSIFLSLPYKGIYGDSLAVQHVRIYELNDSIIATTFTKPNSYYQFSTLPVGSELIGESTFVPNLEDSVYINNNKTVPLMKIPLSLDFANRIVTLKDTLTNTIFKNNFKGLFITVDDANTPGTGAIMYLNPTSQYSRIYMYYRYINTSSKPDTSSFSFYLNGERFMNFDHNGYQGADPDLISQFNGNTETAGDKLFLQSTGGAKIKFSLPYIKNLASRKIAIHEASLILENADTLSHYPIPSLLAIRSLTDKGQYEPLIDEKVEGASYLGGYASDNKYRFRITRYIQNRVLNPDEKDYGLVVLNVGGSVTANHVVIKGPKTGTGRMRLLIYYTPVK
ncbi:MAG TPA: DUF4270 domain-containing protein, partial [Lentimicrobium sp.]|nr:DUF4270 domain-containing protein [Lentimicrobium sp.]